VNKEISSKTERKDFLDQLVARKSATGDGMNWLRKSLDPFHDFEVTVKGMPDASTGKVVVREVTKTQTISAPAGLAPGANWDANFFTLPDMVTSGYKTDGDWAGTFSYVSNVGVVGNVNKAGSQPAAGSYEYGPFNCFSTTSGALTAPKSGANFDPACGDNKIIGVDEFVPGQKRVLAMAFEVHDTTAELYKQGSVTVYRQPQANTECGLNMRDVSTVAGTAVSASVPALKSRAPPGFVADAMLLTGSAQWEAREGAYCVSYMRPEENDVEGAFQGTRLFTQGDTATTTSYQPAICGRRQVVAVNVPPAVSTAIQAYNRPIPFDTVGAYFSGLNSAATLTWTVKILIEDHPTAENTQLVTLAHPGAEYDPIALELYKAATLHLRAGVKVSDNASGDFWDSVLDAIEIGAETLGPLLPGVGKPLSMAVAAGTKIAKKAKEKKASDRKQITPGFSSNPGGNNAVKARKGGKA
jgi:hypothetical protein